MPKTCGLNIIDEEERKMREGEDDQLEQGDQLAKQGNRFAKQEDPLAKRDKQTAEQSKQLKLYAQKLEQVKSEIGVQIAEQGDQLAKQGDQLANKNVQSAKQGEQFKFTAQKMDRLKKEIELQLRFYTQKTDRFKKELDTREKRLLVLIAKQSAELKLYTLKMDGLKKEIGLLDNRLQVTIFEGKQSKDMLHQSQNELQNELHTYLSFVSLGIDPQDIAFHRFIPVRAYLPEEMPNEVASINQALEALFNALNVSVSDDFPAETGSWFKRFFVRTNDLATQPEVAERLQKIERALDIKGLDTPQSLIDKNKAEAISTVLSSLEKVPSAVIQFGSLVIIKFPDSQSDPRVLVRTLSQQELIILEKNPHPLKNPQDLDLMMEKATHIDSLKSQKILEIQSQPLET